MSKEVNAYKKGKGVGIAIYGTPSHNYGVSLAVWDHTVLPATRHKRTLPAFTPARQAYGTCIWSEVSAEMMLSVAGATRECVPRCLQIPDDKLTDDDGAMCWFTDDIIPCMWACNGTCFVPDFPGITEVGGIYISTESSSTEPEIEMYEKHFSNSSNLLVL